MLRVQNLVSEVRTTSSVVHRARDFCKLQHLVSSLQFMACVLFTQAINWSGKSAVHNLQYYHQTHLVRGIYTCFWSSHMFTFFLFIFLSTMFTASTDKTLGIWDFETGTRIKKLKGHTSFVNSCFPSRRGPQFIVSGADDCTVKVCCNTFAQGLHFFLPCFLMIINFQSENIIKGKCYLLLRTLVWLTGIRNFCFICC